ncbi:hypothetical protein B0H19DRAFT_1246300 [Mycena capillaripes]|nr:hypothetical protein B0H19DRAFT_1246300 [Mycena capillaripes]
MYRKKWVNHVGRVQRDKLNGAIAPIGVQPGKVVVTTIKLDKPAANLNHKDQKNTATLNGVEMSAGFCTPSGNLAWEPRDLPHDSDRSLSSHASYCRLYQRGCSTSAISKDKRVRSACTVEGSVVNSDRRSLVYEYQVTEQGRRRGRNTAQRAG